MRPSTLDCETALAESAEGHPDELACRTLAPVAGPGPRVPTNSSRLVAQHRGKWCFASFRCPPPHPAADQQKGNGNPRYDGEILKGVPTILMVGPYRVYFYSHEPNEPPHVHVDRDDESAKFWLDPVALARNLGFGPVELRRVHRLVAENRNFLLEKWYERFQS